jgi:peptide/nickel transport system permease protein
VFIAIITLLAIFVPPPLADPPVNRCCFASPPSADHVFGTDRLGRDILSRVLWGARIAAGGVGVVALSGVLGTLFGVIAGYFGLAERNRHAHHRHLARVSCAILAMVTVTILGNSWDVVRRSAWASFPLRVRAGRSCPSASVSTWRRRVRSGSSPRVTGITCSRRSSAELGTLQIPTAILTEALLSFLGLLTEPRPRGAT